MRGNTLKGTHGRMNGQFYSLFHRDDAWPKFLVFIIIVFYVTIFALFALSYTYIFSGLWGSGTGTGRLPVRAVGYQVDSLKDATILPNNLTASVDANALEIPSADKMTAPVARTNVRVNGTTVPIPTNGSVHKEISTDNGNASINVNVQSNGSSSSESTSTIDLNVSSSSNTVSEEQQ